MRFGRSAVAAGWILSRAVGMAAAADAADDPARTVITVSSQVRVAADAWEPLGVNNFGDVGGLRASRGNLINDAGFEPARVRRLCHVILSGKDNGRCWVTLDGPGTSDYLQSVSGGFSGARMRAYRFVDAQGSPLPYQDAKWAQEGKVLDASTGTACIKLFDSKVLSKGTPGFPDGGWLCTGADAKDYPTWDDWAKVAKEQKPALAPGWRVYYEADVPLRMDDVVIFEKAGIVWPDPSDYHPRVSAQGIGGSWDATVHGSYRYIAHDGPLPPEMDGGRAAMELTPQDGKAEVWQKQFGATGRADSFWYGTLDGGVAYRYEAWVKEVGAQGGEVVLGLGANKEGGLEAGYFGHAGTQHAFPAPTGWTRVGFTFVAPPPPADGGIEGAIIRYNGTGRLFVDNVSLQPVYKDGTVDRPFVVYRPLLQTLLENQPTSGRKGALRSWFGLNDAAMASLCDWHPEGEVRFQAGKLLKTGVRQNPLPVTLTVCDATGDAPATRMVPWIMTQVTHDEGEYRQLIEYLCAPYDPARDTPAAKPLAHLRYRQRGHGRPWSDDFREIIIEFGNENWHNRANPDWIGMGRNGHIWGGGREYGLWAGYMIGEMRKSPYYDAAKIRHSLGGAYSTRVENGETTGFQPEAVRGSGGAADYTGPATYIGPRWETGESSQTAIDDRGVQRTLLCYRIDKEAEWSTQEDSMRILRQQGFKTRLTAYEGGPSGFGLRAKSKEEDLAGEYYGKSYAMGTAVLDAWLDAFEKGWTYQCYLSFGQGRWWNSHTSFAQGHRPSPGWLSQELINHHLANRDLLTVGVTNSPVARVELPRSEREIKQAKPARVREAAFIHAHAAGGPGDLAVAVVNLDLGASHPVDIRLPLPRAARITRHYLDGDPRDTNLEAFKVKAASETIDPARLTGGVFQAELAPGTASVFVFER